MGRSLCGTFEMTSEHLQQKKSDLIIETYLSCLEERLLDIEIPSKRYKNLINDERDALYSLKVLLLLFGAEKIT